MALEKVSGTVMNFREETEITSSQTSNFGHTTHRTQKLINFRVGRTPVSMKMPKGIELTDGDHATVVGTGSGGGLKAVLVRNDETGVTYGMSTWYVMFWAIVLLVIGVATLGVIIGLFLTPIGLYLLYKGYQLIQANKLMDEGGQPQVSEQ